MQPVFNLRPTILKAMVSVLASVLGLALGNVCPASFNPGIVLCQNNYLTEACRSDYLAQCRHRSVGKQRYCAVAPVSGPSPPSPPAETTVRRCTATTRMPWFCRGRSRPDGTMAATEPLVVEMQEIIGQTGRPCCLTFTTEHWFFGRRPRKRCPHQRVGCVDRGRPFNWNDMKPTQAHKRQWLLPRSVVPTPQLDSANRFQLGFFINDTQMCFYEPNNEEIDHLSEGVALALLMLYSCLWIG